MQHMEPGEHSLSIWLSGEDLPHCEREVSALVHKLREQAGLDPWPEVEADCFQAGDELLILARPASPKARSFFFPDLESLLGAVFSCQGEHTALYGLEKGYLLTVSAEEVRSSLYEFGTEYPLHRDWESFAREQGMCLIPNNAAEKLVRSFSTDRL